MSRKGYFEIKRRKEGRKQGRRKEGRKEGWRKKGKKKANELERK